MALSLGNILRLWNDGAQPRESGDAVPHLKQPVKFLGGSSDAHFRAGDVERRLGMIREDAKYVEQYASEMSRRRKRPVLILCNARSGTLLHPSIENSLDSLADDAAREEFASRIVEEPQWRVPGGKWAAMFAAAREWLESGRMADFIYSSDEIKVSSCRKGNLGNAVVATPHGLENLLRDGCCDILFADYSEALYPGSFSKETGCPRCPGVSEYILGNSPDYTVLLATRRHIRHPYEDHLPRNVPERALEEAAAVEGPVAVCLNALSPDHKKAYDFVDNHPELLGEFGYRMGSDHWNKTFVKHQIKTTHGEMELDRYVRQFLGQHGSC